MATSESVLGFDCIFTLCLRYTVLYEFLGRRSFIDPICCNSCMVLSMFLRLVLANPLFSLWDINLTLGLLLFRRHVVWRDSVGVESSGSWLKIRVRGYFSLELSLVVVPCWWAPKRAKQLTVYGYNPAPFWVLSVSCWCLAELIFT